MPTYQKHQIDSIVCPAHDYLKGFLLIFVPYACLYLVDPGFSVLLAKEFTPTADPQNEKESSKRDIRPSMARWEASCGTAERRTPTANCYGSRFQRDVAHARFKSK